MSRPIPARASSALLVMALLATAPVAHAQYLLPADFVDVAVVTGLPEPVGMAFLPDGRLLFIERATARLRLIAGGAIPPGDPVLTVPDVDASYGEEGLLGVAVDPGWPARPYVYVQHTVASAPVIRIARFTVNGDLAFAGNGALAIDPASRYDVIADAPHAAEFHNGGTLRFGPDGMLYSSLGDYSVCGSQTLGDLLGKILRLDVSALPAGPGGPAPRALITPADNPFVAHADPDARLVWQQGLRNPFRFGIDPVTGAMVIGDVGGSQREELDWAAAPGSNFQWPIYEGGIPGPYTCAGVDSTAFAGPIHQYDHSEGAAVIGGVVYRRPPGASEPFPPEYDGDILFCDFYGNWVRRLDRVGAVWSLEPAPGQPNATDWGSGPSWITDWLVAPDGSLWYCRMLTGNSTGPGQIRRIRYTGVVGVAGATVPGIELRPPYPSPAAGPTTLAWALPVAAGVSLTIHDLAGRRVRVLAAGERFEAGSHRSVWDGRDDAGRPLAAGVYRARLTVGGAAVERRLVRLD